MDDAERILAALDFKLDVECWCGRPGVHDADWLVTYRCLCYETVCNLHFGVVLYKDRMNSRRICGQCGRDTLVIKIERLRWELS